MKRTIKRTIKRTSVTIGIPAYNEDRTIKVLIQDILKQKTKSITIKKIIVYSDGSTDKTVEQVHSLDLPVVTIIDSQTRNGKAVGVNIILENTDTDVLVLLDADIIIKDEAFLEKLVAPIITNLADLTSAKVLELDANNLLQRTLKVSMDLKRSIFEEWNNGNNLYTCHGRARALNKQLYSKLRFPFSPNEDAFSYLYCKYSGFRYEYIGNTAVYYSLPKTLSDHIKQSVRFFQYTARFEEYFDKETIKTEYRLPTDLKLKKVLKFLILNPTLLILYIVIAFYTKSLATIVPVVGNKWDISDTSKKASV